MNYLDALYHTEISSRAKTALTIMQLRPPEEITRHNLTLWLGVCERTVDRVLAELRQWGFVKRSVPRHVVWTVNPDLEYVLGSTAIEGDRQTDVSVEPTKWSPNPLSGEQTKMSGEQTKMSGEQTKMSVGQTESEDHFADQLADPNLDFTDCFLEEMYESTRESPADIKIKTPPPKKGSKFNRINKNIPPHKDRSATKINQNTYDNFLSFQAVNTHKNPAKPNQFPALLPKEGGGETVTQETNIYAGEKTFNKLEKRLKEKQDTKTYDKTYYNIINNIPRARSQYSGNPLDKPLPAGLIVDNCLHPESVDNPEYELPGSAWEEVLHAVFEYPNSESLHQLGDTRGQGDAECLHAGCLRDSSTEYGLNSRTECTPHTGGDSGSAGRVFSSGRRVGSNASGLMGHRRAQSGSRSDETVEGVPEDVPASKAAHRAACEAREGVRTPKSKTGKAKRSVATRRIGERQKRINRAKEIALKKAQGKKLKGKLEPAVAMAFAYEDVLSDYQYKPTMKLIKHRQYDPKKKGWQIYAQAAKLATICGADFVDFVRAQFYWIHIWFGRECKSYELRSKNGKFSAIERYHQYMKLRSEGKAPAKVTATSLGLVSVTGKKLDEINKKRLDKLCELWEEDQETILISFVPEGIFDEDWLQTNETYLKLQREGKI